MTFSFTGDIAFWIDDEWNLIKRTLDFRHLQIGDHEGPAAAGRFAKAMASIGALKKIYLTFI